MIYFSAGNDNKYQFKLLGCAFASFMRTFSMITFHVQSYSSILQLLYRNKQCTNLKCKIHGPDDNKRCETMKIKRI